MYADIAALANDVDFLGRVTACAATEGDPDPETWTWGHRWEMAGQPGFGDAYASAIAGGVERPGKDPAVITDPQILSAVQSIGP
jgi:hypothetical protein